MSDRSEKLLKQYRTIEQMCSDAYGNNLKEYNDANDKKQLHSVPCNS